MCGRSCARVCWQQAALELRSRADCSHSPLQDLLQHAGGSKPQLLKSVQKAVATYLSNNLPISDSTKDSSQQLLRPGADGSWEWGNNLPGAAALLQGLMLCLELTVPEELSPVPAHIRQQLPARWVLNVPGRGSA